MKTSLDFTFNVNGKDLAPLLKIARGITFKMLSLSPAYGSTS